VLNSRRPVEDRPSETLIVLSEDGTAEILPVADKNEERILAGQDGEIAVPIGDLMKYNGKRGRIWVYPSTIDNITDCHRIANLEQSTVLKQITHYVPQAVEPLKSFDLTKMLLFGLVVIELIIIAAK
jgi:hypothetical protein